MFVLARQVSRNFFSLLFSDWQGHSSACDAIWWRSTSLHLAKEFMPERVKIYVRKDSSRVPTVESLKAKHSTCRRGVLAEQRQRQR